MSPGVLARLRIISPLFTANRSDTHPWAFLSPVVEQVSHKFTIFEVHHLFLSPHNQSTCAVIFIVMNTCAVKLIPIWLILFMKNVSTNERPDPALVAAGSTKSCLLQGLSTPAPCKQPSVPYKKNATHGLYQQGSPHSPLHLLQSGDQTPPPSRNGTRNIRGERRRIL